MDLSHTQETQLTCPQCGTSFEVRIWLILDLTAHTELKESINTGTYHRFSCPHCQTNSIEVDAPLLLYEHGALPPLQFLPARATAPDEDYQRATELVSLFRERLKNAVILPDQHTPPNDIQVPPELHASLCTAHEILQNYHTTGRIATLEKALAQWQQILAHPFFLLVPEQFQIIVLNDTGSAFLQHYWATGQADDLDTTVQLWKYAIYRLPLDSAYLSILFMNLAVCLNTRFERLGQFSDLQQAIDACRVAVASTDEASPNLPTILSNLGLALRDSYNHTGQIAELNEAIQALQQALALTSGDIINQAYCQTNLGLSLLDRYQRLGLCDDLEQSITLCNAAITQTPPDVPEHARFLTNLAKGLHARYKQNGDLHDIERAIAAFQQAVDVTVHDAPDLSIYCSNLGLSLHDRYKRLGQMNDLDQAIQELQRAEALVEVTSPRYPIILSNLGLVLHDRYRHHGNFTDLEQAISAFERAVRLIDEKSPYYPSFLGNLGMSMGDRYELTGRSADLEQCIWAYQNAVAYLPPNAPERANHLSHLGSGMFDRYTQTGRLIDLQGAIDAFQQAAQLAPQQTPARALYLMNVGVGLRSRYTHGRNLNDLEQAIVAFQQAVDQNVGDDPERARYLSGLAASLHDRYVHTHQLEDLEQSISAFRRVLALIPSGSQQRPNYLNNLGTALRSRYLHSRQQEDLQESLRLLHMAVQETTSKSPQLPTYLNNLGLSLEDRYSYTGETEDLQEAILVYEQACQKGLLVAPDIALSGARSWGNWASRRKQWAEATRAYTYGIQATEHLYQIQLSRESQETWLSSAIGLHARAAYALARLNRLIDAANILEQGRARRLREVLGQDRAELARVHNEAPEVYHRYLQAASRLNQIEQAEKEEQRLSKQKQIEYTLTRRLPQQERFSTLYQEELQQAQAELQAAIAQIRSLPGHAGFLKLPSQQVISESTSILIYLATTPTGSFALLVPPAHSTPTVIWDDTFNEAQLNALLIQHHNQTNETIGGYLPGQLFHPAWLQEALKQINKQLGTSFIAPLAEALCQQNVRQAVLIPIGLFGLLPLHAICYQKEQQTYCLLDEFAVAYAPSGQVYGVVNHEAKRRKQQSSKIPLNFVGIGNPLPGELVVQQAHQDLCPLLPMMQQLLDSYSPLHSSNDTLLSPEQSQFQTLLKLWQETLERLADACQSEASTLLYSGLDLQRLIIMFSLFRESFPDLTLDADNIATLFRLTNTIPPDLPYAESELESIVSLLPNATKQIFYEQSASRMAVWRAFPGAHIVHFACHGSFETKQPLESALQLAGDHLTLNDLLTADASQFAHLRMVVLSACQTAISDFQHTPDEVLSLMSGFLQAGVPAVIGTLWSVNDCSSALLLVRFYQYYLYDDRYRNSPAQALRLAQCWLRNLTYDDLYRYLQQQVSQGQIQFAASIITNLLPGVRKARRENRGTERPYADTYYWGAFVYYGTLQKISDFQ